MTFKIKKKLLYQNKSRTLGLNISVIKQSINMINFRSITNIYTVNINILIPISCYILKKISKTYKR